MLAGALALAGAAAVRHGQAAARPGPALPRVALAGAQVPLLGTSVSNKAQLAYNTARYGHMPIVRVYYRRLPSANAWSTGLAGANDSAVIVSFNARPHAILSGADDSVLTHFFDTAPRGHAIYYSYVHEPEHEVTRHEFTAAAYKAAWAHVAALAQRAGNPWLHSILILTAYDLKPGAHRNWRDYLPGGDIISTLGWDAYPGGHVAKSPARFMAPAVAASKSAGLPFGFAEFGLSSPVGRTAWLTQVGNYLMSSGAVFGTLFDSAAVHPSFSLTEAATMDVWRRFVRDSARAGDGPLPGGSVTPPGGSGSPPGRPVVRDLRLIAPDVSPRGWISARFYLTARAYVTISVLSRNGQIVTWPTILRHRSGWVQASTWLPAVPGTYTVRVSAAAPGWTSQAQEDVVVPRW